MAVAKTPTPKDLLDQLARRFDPKDVGQRTQGGKRLDYIGIDKTITRFNEVLGADWSFTVTDHSIERFQGKNKSGDEVTKYLATVAGEIEALGKRAGGVGADVAEDPDKALKTALAEALKKSSHQMGMSLYLWDEEERENVQTIRTQVAADPTDDVTPLKTQVMHMALKAGVPADASKIAEHFKVTVEQLQDINVLKELVAYG